MNVRTTRINLLLLSSTTLPTYIFKIHYSTILSLITNGMVINSPLRFCKEDTDVEKKSISWPSLATNTTRAWPCHLFFNTFLLLPLYSK